MSDLKYAFEQVIWQVLEKHYNIDRSEPRVLTYKHIQVKDPIGDLATQITEITEELIKQSINQVAEQMSKKESETDTPPEQTKDDDEDTYLSHYWYGSE